MALLGRSKRPAVQSLDMDELAPQHPCEPPPMLEVRSEATDPEELLEPLSEMPALGVPVGEDDHVASGRTEMLGRLRDGPTSVNQDDRSTNSEPT